MHCVRDCVAKRWRTSSLHALARCSTGPRRPNAPRPPWWPHDAEGLSAIAGIPIAGAGHPLPLLVDDLAKRMAEHFDLAERDVAASVHSAQAHEARRLLVRVDDPGGIGVEMLLAARDLFVDHAVDRQVDGEGQTLVEPT